MPMKHVIDITPALLVIVELIHADGFACFPVVVDELAEHNRIPFLNVDFPLVKPASAIRGA